MQRARSTHFLGMHRDVTEMHRLEREVRNQKALIESVVDSAPVAIALLDREDRVMLDNHEYKKLMGDLRVRSRPHAARQPCAPNWRDGLAQRRDGNAGLRRPRIRIDRAGGRAALVLVYRHLGASRCDGDGADSYFCARQDSLDLLLVVSRRSAAARRAGEGAHGRPAGACWPRRTASAACAKASRRPSSDSRGR